MGLQWSGIGGDDLYKPSGPRASLLNKSSTSDNFKIQRPTNIYVGAIYGLKL